MMRLWGKVILLGMMIISLPIQSGTAANDPTTVTNPSPRFYWNVWIATAKPLTLQPVSRLHHGTDYLLVIDLSSVPYRNEGGRSRKVVSIGQDRFSKDVSDWLNGSMSDIMLEVNVEYPRDEGQRATVHGKIHFDLTKARKRSARIWGVDGWINRGPISGYTARSRGLSGERGLTPICNIGILGPT